MKKRNWDKLYEKYVQDYHKQEAKGIPMTQLMDKSTYKAVYIATENDRLAEVAAGQRKTLGAINRDIVNQSADYNVSAKQAQKLSKAAKELGIKVGNWTNLRKDEALQQQVFDAIADNKAQLKKAGFTVGEINKMIGRDFFGSP